MGQLAPSAIAELRRALDDYDRAELGRLNITADTLFQTCRRLGWTGRNDSAAWARQMLESKP
jgi:hypothetical protein